MGQASLKQATFMRNHDHHDQGLVVTVMDCMQAPSSPRLPLTTSSSTPTHSIPGPVRSSAYTYLACRGSGRSFHGTRLLVRSLPLTGQSVCNKGHTQVLAAAERDTSHVPFDAWLLTVCLSHAPSHGIQLLVLTYT